MQHTLGITDCGLFDPAHERVHFTSALRYPVFVDGANYNGNPLGRPLLRGMCERFLAEEVRQFPGALWFPLGPKPAAALRHLVSLGILPADRVLEGLPHPRATTIPRVMRPSGGGQHANAPETNARDAASHVAWA